MRPLNPYEMRPLNPYEENLLRRLEEQFSKDDPRLSRQLGSLRPSPPERLTPSRWGPHVLVTTGRGRQMPAETGRGGHTCHDSSGRTAPSRTRLG